MHDNLLRGWIRYAGGKRSLRTEITERFLARPKRRLTSTCVGGGSIELLLAQTQKLNSVVLADANPAIRALYERPLEGLLLSVASELSFDTLKRMLNEHLENGQYSSRLVAALIWAYGRRTNNGILRVNSKGFINVSEGKDAKQRPLSITEDDIRHAVALSRRLHAVPVTVLASAIEAVDRAFDEWLFSDPPYTGGFVGYTKECWGQEDDEQLFAALARAHQRGCNVVLCQPDTAWARECAAKHLPGWDIAEVQMRRSVNSDGKGRAPVGELLIWSR